MPKLRIKQGNDFQEVLIGDTTFKIGRAAGSDYVINSGFISRNHCEIIPEGNDWILVDLGSALGTQLNDKPVTRAVLNPGDRICLSDKFEAFFSPDEIHVDNTATLRIVTGGPTPPQKKQNRLVALDGPMANKAFNLKRGSTRIGRAEDNDISIPVDTISKYHAEITVDAHGVFITDQGSGNGTFVGNTRIRRHQLQPGDLMRFDWVTFRFEDPDYRQDTTGTRIRIPKTEAKAKAKPVTNDTDTDRVAEVELARASVIRNMSMRIKKARGGEQNTTMLVVLALFVFGFVGAMSVGGYFLYDHMTSLDYGPLPSATVGNSPTQTQPVEQESQTSGQIDSAEAPQPRPVITPPPPAPPPYEGPDFDVVTVDHRPADVTPGQEMWLRFEFMVNRPSILLTESVRLYRGSKLLAKPIETTGEWPKNLQSATHRFHMPSRLKPGLIQIKITLSSANTVIERTLDINVE